MMMNKKFNHVIILSILSVACVAYAQQAVDSISDLTQQYSTTFQAAEVKYNTPIKLEPIATTSNANDKTTKPQTAKNGADSNKKTQNLNNTQSQPAQMPICNCYNESNPDNYPNNFLYNATRIRIQRIDPACQCAKPKKTDDTLDTTDNSEDNTALSSPVTRSINSSTPSSNVIAPPANGNHSSTSSSNDNNSNQNFGITY